MISGAYVPFEDVILISFRQIYRTRRRYAGPLIGGILGSAALIMVICLGHRVEKGLGNSLAVIGQATLIKLNLNAPPDHPLEDPQEFFDQDVNMIRRIPGVILVTPTVFSWWPAKLSFTVVRRDRVQRNVRILGVEEDFFRLAHLTVAEGRQINKEDVAKHRGVCVIGNGLREWLLEFEDLPLGKPIFVGDLRLKVVGVLAEPDDSSIDEAIFLPISVARSRLPHMRQIRRLTVLPEGLDVVETVSERISQAVKSRSRLSKCQVIYDKELLSICRNVLRTFRLFSYAAICTTLLLGTIGVANVTLAMVKERTTEIGLRKAVGATDADIAWQFLFESLTVSLVSSITGTMIGTSVVVAVSALLWGTGIEFRILVLAILISAVFGCASGIASGVFPAWKAGNLDPVTAMKFE
jgi:putative ABC transport system permease protein